jgi:hypothetical protein
LPAGGRPRSKAGRLPSRAPRRRRRNDTCFPTATYPMTRRSDRQGASPAGAGALLIGAILMCAAVGLGIGLVLGVPAPLGLAGGFIGVGVGFWLVYDRFKDL